MSPPSDFDLPTAKSAGVVIVPRVSFKAIASVARGPFVVALCTDPAVCEPVIMTGVVNHGIFNCIDVYAFFTGSFVAAVKTVHSGSFTRFKIGIVNIRTGETGGNGGNKYKSKNSSNDLFHNSLHVVC